ncbi:hypothetical protein AOLI_G00158210 [Acnodon oligacanthus]
MKGIPRVKPTVPTARESTKHYFCQCSGVTKLSKDQLKEWIQAYKCCWCFTRAHRASQCTLKKPCNLCQGTHLLSLHGLNTRTGESYIDVTVQEESCLTNSTSESFYLAQPDAGNCVLRKVVPVLIRYGGRTLDTFTILDDGSEKSMLLQAAAKSLGMRSIPEALPLHTVCQDIQVLHGHTVSFHVSPVANPQTGYEIKGAFTAGRLSLAHHTYPIERLQRKFRHLRGLPIPALRDAKPSLLIGSDQPHLVTLVESVRLGPPGGYAAMHTRLGYVERPWRVDTIPQRHYREVTRLKQDQQAIMMLEAKTVRIQIDGILRYATPLLRHVNMPLLYAPK